jgi:hypothetical protein
MVKCVGCQSLVASTESYKHYIACPHGPCGCTEAINTGCSFTGPPRELLVHLQASHSIPVFTFQYGIPAWCIVRVPVQPRGHLFIGSGEEDGSVFAITVGALGPTTIVSCVCIMMRVAFEHLLLKTVKPSSWPNDTISGQGHTPRGELAPFHIYRYEPREEYVAGDPLLDKEEGEEGF